jgi:3-phenylpropionate/trans-cinnamate dioxygenase ferredoxin subunit
MTALVVARADSIGPGQLKAVQVRVGPEPEVVGEAQEEGPPGTVAIVLARTVEGAWHAMGDVCSHGPVLLSEGEFDGCALECWGHGSRFDLTTGVPENLPATSPVPVYPVEVVAGQVVIHIDEETNDNA